jgi:hypothetical protein
MDGYDLESGESPVPAEAPEVKAPETAPVPELTPAVQRFQSCRWRKPAENGTPDHCTHRDVQPITGTTGFNADAWCPDCGSYKTRRNPRKRPAPESYYY